VLDPDPQQSSSPHATISSHRVRDRIVVLDDQTINQIAAGEVVERPASVVKELVENAIDAQASRITLTLSDVGRELIHVSDNGTGMDPADLQNCVTRHATSKISRVEDLNAIATLGFRGEAIPSIASVSRMRISSGTLDGTRSLLELEPGSRPSLTTEAGARGTDIWVEDLFFNTPARLKFLKSDPTELSLIVETVSKYAVLYPQIAFRLLHQGSVLLATHGSADLASTLAEVWGRDVVRGLSPIDFSNAEVRVQGLVSPPHFTKPTRSSQWFFVNGRPVKNRTILAAIDQAYRSLTPEKRYPLAVLKIEVCPSKVDVNVSPTKAEVKFQQEGGIFDAIRRAVREGLLEHGMLPSVDDIAAANFALAGFSLENGLGVGQSALTFNNFRESTGGGSSEPNGPFLVNALSGQSGETVPSAHLGSQFADGLRVIGQLHSTFILAENASGLLIVDQHVAHERVIYERLRRTRGAQPIERQKLLVPEAIHVDRRSSEALAERLDELASIGFELEPFGGQSFLVRSVPALIRGASAIQVLRDLVTELADGLGAGCLNDTRDEILILCSCKMAVKAGDALGIPEMERLLAELSETENPYFCPHGRPITLVFGKPELYRRFKRSV